MSMVFPLRSESSSTSEPSAGRKLCKQPPACVFVLCSADRNGHRNGGQREAVQGVSTGAAVAVVAEGVDVQRLTPGRRRHDAGAGEVRVMRRAVLKRAGSQIEL